MFRKASKSETSIGGSGRAGMPTIIGADFRVKGDISCEGDIQLEGTVHGNIKSLRLTVGETGVIEGDVNADAVRVQGKIVGTIRAKSVDLAGTGHVTGDILHEQLSVENGAEVKAGVAKSKFKDEPGFGEKIPGHIMLTYHGDEAWIRSIKIRELK